jgi:hypothetical protein
MLKVYDIERYERKERTKEANREGSRELVAELRKLIKEHSECKTSNKKSVLKAVKYLTDSWECANNMRSYDEIYGETQEK